MQKTSLVSDYLLKQGLKPEIIHAMANVVDSDNTPHIMSGSKIIADIFGVTPVFTTLIEGTTEESDTCELHLINSFHNNLALLVQKTWAEKSDEVLKEQILYKLNNICKVLNEKSYIAVYEDFFVLLHDIVYLMFGSLSKKDDFDEYALRIDPEFGIFWWFLQNVSFQTPQNDEICRLYILLSMVFLANY
ncbi:MAG: hypothetical protein R3Y36_01195 [Spirochaetales bacterium]